MGRSVLLIEDEKNIIAAISFLLARDGWTVRTHSDGHRVLDDARAEPPDVVILDVMLPGKSGFDILRELRSDSLTRDIPVLMLTAKSQKTDQDLARLAGADRFMTKPFSNAEMLDAVRSLAGSA